MKMTYDESLSYIHSLLKFGTRPGLERVSALLRELGNPQEKLKFVHVAGTNGKGSFCAMTSEILRSAGYKTGMFTSPYVFNFRERMQINGEMIGEDEFAALANSIKPIVDDLAKKDLQPTEFEVITAAALKYFADNNCDIVVLEVGLGGRLDSTNIISSSLLSVIMSISLDHTAVLGDTIEAIANEKSGIIKEKGITLCFSNQNETAEEIIRRTARDKNNKYIKSSPDDIRVISSNLSGTKVIYKNLEFTVPLIGAHQVYNAQTTVDAAFALRDIGLNISDENIIKGIERARIPARMELFGKNPVTILDGAHNEEGAGVLMENLKNLLPGKKLTVIMGMMEDKDYSFAAKGISALAKSFTAVLPSNPRAVLPETLAKIAKENCDKVFTENDPVKAYEEAYKNAEKDDVILVCGSLYLASDVRPVIDKMNSRQN